MITTVRILVLSILFGFTAFSLKAQYPVNDSSGKWGAIDATGKEVIARSFEFISEFDQNGRALFKQNGKYGVLNATGKVLIPANYDRITPAKELFICFNELKCGVYTAAHQEVIAPEYDFIRHFADSLFLLIKDNKAGLGHIAKKVVLPVAYDFIAPFEENAHITTFQKNGKSGIISLAGEVLIDAISDSVQLNGNLAKAWQQRNITVFKVNEAGELLSQEKFVNQAALDLAEKNLLNERNKAALSQNSDLRKARWQKFGFRYKLVNGVGVDLLGKEFFDVGEDPQSDLAIAREVRGEKEEQKTISYIVDMIDQKVLLIKDLEDIMITDFAQGGMARATVDTLWDALIDLSGNIIREVATENAKLPIQNIGNFENKLAWVKSGNRFGFINPQGKVIIPITYEVVSDFANGYAIARKNGLFGCIDTQGKEVLPFKFDGISLPESGLVRIKKGKGTSGKWGLLDLKQNEVLPFEYQLIGPFLNGMATILQNGKYGLINQKGKVILPPTFSVDLVEITESGLLMLKDGRYTQETGVGPVLSYHKFGFALADGTILLDPVYNDTGNFEEIWKKQQGLTEVKIQGKVGYVNYKGNLVLPAEYEEAPGFDSIWRLNKGIAKVRKNKKYGYVNHHGNEIIASVYDQIEGYEQAWKDSVSWVRAQKNGAFGLLNYAGEQVIPFEYQAIKETSDEVVLVQKAGKWGAINFQNKPVIPIENDGIRFLEGSDKKLIGLLKETSVTYFVSSDGKLQAERPVMVDNKVQLPTSKYEILAYFPSWKVGIAVSKDLKALIDQDGKVITKFAYREIKPFSEGLAVFQKDDKDPRKWQYGFLNAQGQEVIASVYQDALPFSEGKAVVKSKNRWGVIDSSGKWVLSPKYNSLTSFSEGFAIAEKTIIVDSKAQEVGNTLAYNGEIVSAFSSRLAIVKTNNGFVHIQPDGLPAYPMFYDEITDFCGEIAFAKKGEVWELTRMFNKTFENKVKFTKAGMESYIGQYGSKRKIKTVYGDLIEDLNWEKLENGKWKMIGKEGSLINDAVFAKVEKLLDKPWFKVTLSSLYGIVNQRGEIIVDPSFETLKEVDKSLIRLEKAGQIYYLSTTSHQLVWPANK